MIMRLIVSLLIIGLVFSTAYGEESQSDPFQLGKQYYEQGAYAKAYDSLFDAFMKDPGNYDINLYLARAAFEQGDYEAAIMAYERILVAYPDRTEFKLAVARCYIRLGAYQAAEQHLAEIVKDPAAGTEFKKAAEGHLLQLEQARADAADADKKKHSISGFFIPKYSRDSNVRVSPSSNVVTTTLGDITLPSALVSEKRDDIVSSTLGLNHLYKLSGKPFLWKNFLFVHNARNSTESDLDVDLFGLTSGFTRQTDSYSWDVRGLFNQLIYQDHKYLRSAGVGGDYSVSLRPYLILKMNAGAEKKSYQQSGDEGKDATNLKVSLGPVLKKGNSEFALRLGGEDENASVDSNSYRRISGTLKYTWKPNQDFTFSASYQRKNTDYDSVATPFTVERSDDVDVFSVEVLKKIWTSANKKLSLTPKLEYSYTDSSSNIALYEYDKNIISLSMIFMF